MVFSDKLNCLTGNNGMGKTNLLDGIFYLCMCKSNFISTDSKLVKINEAFFRLEGHFEQEEHKLKVVAKVQPRKTKVMELNDVPYKKFSEHIGQFPVVMIIPDDTQLASEGSEIRRKFLDNTLSQLDAIYLKHLMLYNKVLKQRNAALKQFAKTGRFDENLILGYDAQMIPAALYIHDKRKTFIENFLPTFNKYYAIISGELEEVDCTYKSTLIADDFQDLLLAARDKDRILQRTTVGIHKDDMLFSMDGLTLKGFASQGQLKSFVLAMKLAQYEVLKQEKKSAPILLLDDIFDKLDEDRVRHLIGLLLDHNFGQIFITDTHASRLDTIVQSLQTAYSLFEVQDGQATMIKQTTHEAT